MKLKIIIDNELEEFHGKISSKTYNKIPSDRRPKLTDNDYFHLDLLQENSRQIIIQIDRNIVEDKDILYLHKSGKDLYYNDFEFIEL